MNTATLSKIFDATTLHNLETVEPKPFSPENAVSIALLISMLKHSHNLDEFVKKASNGGDTFNNYISKHDWESVVGHIRMYQSFILHTSPS